MRILDNYFISFADEIFSINLTTFRVSRLNIRINLYLYRYTYPNGQTIVYHAKWVPCADGRVKVEETTDPGLQNFEIYGQELVRNNDTLATNIKQMFMSIRLFATRIRSIYV